MKKSLIVLGVIVPFAAPMIVNAANYKFFGYSQITMQQGDGKDVETDSDGLKFGADRIRLGFKVKQEKAWAKLQVDFNKTDSSGNAACNNADFVTGPALGDTAKALTSCSSSTKIGVPEIIKDAVVGYKIHDVANISAGVFKTPVGMDFNTSGKKLDITKRGMEKGLVLERGAGVMISGRKMGGFGYDLGVFNPAQRSSAVNFGTAADAAAYAARVMYDMGKVLHFEASYGVSGQDSSSNAEDYKVYDLGVSYRKKGISFKGEYIAGSNVKGVKDSNESVWYLHGGYAINKMNEVVIRYYDATSERANISNTKLSNTYLGWNIYLAKKKYNARIQLNYVFASGDKDSYNGSATGKGYTDNVFLAQFQVGF